MRSGNVFDKLTTLQVFLPNLQGAARSPTGMDLSIETRAVMCLVFDGIAASCW